MLDFAKGHATLNDFVLVTDADGSHPLSADDVRFLADRRAGIGGDGVLRAVRGRHVPGWDGDPEAWFMDYRNADGSLAEMCGNGARLFARYLVEEGLVPPDAATIDFGTRAGPRRATPLPDGRVRVWMGRPQVEDAAASVSVDGHDWPATAVDVGNPHAVAVVAADDLAALDLSRQPAWRPDDRFPHGVNVEFVDVVGDRHLRLRVHERGVGETASCGTGTVAAAVAVASARGTGDGTWQIDVPGGTLEVELAERQAWLTGPAVIVARGRVRLPGEEDHD